MTDEQKAARIRAEMRLIGKLERNGTYEARYPCPVCAAGTVRVCLLHKDQNGRIRKSHGHCSTKGCLHWRDE